MKRPASLDLAWLRAHPLPDPFSTRHKEDRGRVLVVGGSAKVPGAVLLAGKAALHAGAGKLHIATARSLAQSLAVTLPEAMVSPVPIDAKGEIASLPPAIMAAAGDSDALLVGPGMASNRTTGSLVARLLRKAGGSCVLDAGAIAAVTRALPETLECVVTPHAGEMAAVTGMAREAIEAASAQVALAFAREHGCLCLLYTSPSPRD